MCIKFFHKILTSRKQILYLTIIDKPKYLNLNHFGQKVRMMREHKGLLLRQMAASLEVDTALVSKMERGERPVNKEQVLKIAAFLKADADTLLTLWMADKIESVVVEEPEVAYRAMSIVRNQLKK